MCPGPLKKVFCWATCLALYAGLSVGHYDWSPPFRDFAVRGYALHVFFSALFFPTLYYILAKLEIHRVWRQIVCASLGVIYAFPHHWIGTDRYYLFRQGRTFWDWREPGLPTPKPDWFWGALHHLPDIPYEAPFFFLLLISGFLALGLWQKTHPAAVKLPWTQALPFVVFAMILLQTWLHLSLRSPYTYIPHYGWPANYNFWCHDYLFKEAKGAVNFDYYLFRSAELLFLDDQHRLPVLSGRIFPMFISSPWSAFINPYYVWLAFNVAAWSLACIAIYYLALNEFGTRCAFFSTLFMASAQGVIVYVAQPKVYVFAITGVSILLALQQWLFGPKHFQPVNALLFGSFCTLFLLTYESQPWLVGLALIAYLKGFNMRWTLLSLAWAFFLYECYYAIINSLPQLYSQPPLLGENPVLNIMTMLEGFHIAMLIRCLLHSLGDFCVVMIHAFNICLVPALWGLFLARSTSKRYFSLLAIAVPAFLTYVFFDLGLSIYSQYPRLVYSAYPLIYMLCGLCLAKLAACPLFVRRPRIGMGLAILIVLLHAAWMNADVFGHPHIYYYWFCCGPAYA
jgi:hypothetical protein